VQRNSRGPPTEWAGRDVLLDTSFLIDLMDDDGDAVEKARE
jgi:hypothetical protein